MIPFEMPEIRMQVFSVEDIITLSGSGNGSWDDSGSIGNGGGAWEEELPR